MTEEREPALLEAAGLVKRYAAKKRVRNPENGKWENAWVQAVDNVSFSLKERETLGIVGESGCGKSTLAWCIMKLTPLSGGKLLFRGREVSGMSQREFRELRPKIQMVFQNPYSSFNPKLTLGRSLKTVGKAVGIAPGEYRERLGKLLEYTGLAEEMLERHPGQLSGGQLQRFALLRALLPQPELLVADEPVSALDVSVQAQILGLLLDLRERLALTMLFISHDLSVVRHVCGRVMVMYLGTVVETAETEELFSHPLHPYTQALIAAAPREYPGQEKERVLLGGEIPNAMEMPTGCCFHPRCPRCVPGMCDQVSPEWRERGAGHFVACHLVGE